MIPCFGLLLALTSNAQEVPRFTFGASGGFTQAVGGSGRRLDMGWNAGAGGGVNFNSHLGALLEFQYNDMGVNAANLANLGFPGGSLKLWSLTVDPILHLNPRGPVDVYLVGGGGLYHRTQEFTAPTVATVTGFDPYFGYYPVNVPANQVLSSYTVNKPGVNGGIGVSFGTKWSAKVFAEARYHRMFIGDRHTDYLPVSFGIRF
ncbi:MAG: outer membrane beta-barrel protein [Bryobacteraceae bacterium]